VREIGRFIGGMALFLACMACAPPLGPASAPGAVADSAVGEFTGPGGAIRIDPEHLTISVGAEAHPLANCSSDELHCFKSEERGFHISRGHHIICSHR